ncbi:YciI family protein [Succinimonas sp.]|uniref:YciI family protein n=1 Tax=Succinimonas sp. TaxID=1936151 RepID=UPI0038637AF1
MWYLIYAEDIENSLAKRTQARPAHLARLQKLISENRLLLAGPNPAVDAEDPGEHGFTGSAIIASFDSLEDAKEWAAQDPYWLEGVYREGTGIVKPLKITAKMNGSSF